MKTTLSLIGMLLAGVLFGASDDMVLSFSTPGVDRYADGTMVRDGESYALVWTANGAKFGGFTSDCRTLSPSDRLVMVASLAKSGHCPLSVLEIDSKEVDGYKGGTFGLYLLDTRVRGADGKVTLAAYRNGRPLVVNSFGASNAEQDTVVTALGMAARMNAGSLVALGKVGVYSEIDPPEITAILVEGAQIRIEVRGMAEAADYFVVPGSVPGAFAPAMNAVPDKDGFTFDKPEEESSFYKVIGVRKFGAAR